MTDRGWRIAVSCLVVMFMSLLRGDVSAQVHREHEYSADFAALNRLASKLLNDAAVSYEDLLQDNDFKKLFTGRKLGAEIATFAINANVEPPVFEDPALRDTLLVSDVVRRQWEMVAKLEAAFDLVVDVQQVKSAWSAKKMCKRE